jgi:hypothetical protein
MWIFFSQVAEYECESVGYHGCDEDGEAISIFR